MLEVTNIPFERRPPLQPATSSLQFASQVSERLQRLDIEAWEELYTEHRRLIRGVLAGQLGYSADLEDVTQQVFETALRLVTSRKVHLAGDNSGMRAWLVAIALRLARGERRRQLKVKLTADQTDEASQATAPLDPASMQLLHSAHRVLMQLPTRLRAPWLLRHLERMSLEEISASTGVSLATVKRRLSAANERFHKLAQRDSVLREHLAQGDQT